MFFNYSVALTFVCSALLLLLSINVVESYRILLVFPFPSTSHFTLGNALAKGLAEAGHHATIITPHEDKNPVIKNKEGAYEEVLLTGFLEAAKEHSVNFFKRHMTSAVLQVPVLSVMSSLLVNTTIYHPNFKKLLASNQQYDAVIVEQFNEDGLKILAHHFKAPLILFSPIGTNSWVNSLVGNPEPPSYISSIFLGYSPPMTFCERLTNSLFRVFADLLRHLYAYPTHDKIVKQAYPNSPNLDTLLYNVSLVLLNSHYSTNQPVPHVPNIIDIGGFHVKDIKPLPKDLQDYMDNARDGVIYFSMGSTIEPSTMPKQKLHILLRTLGNVKEKVLWKWDKENLPNKPKNVRISKWFPQLDILAHPNCKLFITHGGLLSTIETVHSGVPILALPVFGDQSLNSARAQSSGYGMSLLFIEITEQVLSQNLKELLGNPKYRKNAETRSAIMHDRIVKPMDTAVYWVEYVIRHKGAPHLRVAAVNLPLYQYLLLDVIGFLVFVILTFVLVLYFSIKRFCCEIECQNSFKIKKN